MGRTRQRAGEVMVVAAVLVLGCGPTADAQPIASSFEALDATLRAQSPIEVTRDDGTRVTGVFQTVEGGRLVLATGERRLTIDQGNVRRIDTRRHDSLWNGVLIGAGIGGLLGLIPDYYDDCEECHDSLYASIAVGAGVGLLVDALRRERQTVYRSPAGGSLLLGLAAARNRVSFAATVRWH
jgi:ElaB/YqjD/DUF883 family membrane-anchored ribosome-binding protein